jgi:hypothetical protein
MLAMKVLAVAMFDKNVLNMSGFAEGGSFDSIRAFRLSKTLASLATHDSGVAGVLSGQESFNRKMTRKDEAALRIQRVYRGNNGRRIFEAKLLDFFVHEETKRSERMRLQVEEGIVIVARCFILCQFHSSCEITSAKLGQERQDSEFIAKQRIHVKNHSAFIIQV